MPKKKRQIGGSNTGLKREGGREGRKKKRKEKKREKKKKKNNLVDCDVRASLLIVMSEPHC